MKKATMRVEVAPSCGVSAQKAEETKVALRELRLPDQSIRSYRFRKGVATEIYIASPGSPGAWTSTRYAAHTDRRFERTEREV